MPTSYWMMQPLPDVAPTIAGLQVHDRDLRMKMCEEVPAGYCVLRHEGALVVASAEPSEIEVGAIGMFSRIIDTQLTSTKVLADKPVSASEATTLRWYLTYRNETYSWCQRALRVLEDVPRDVYKKLSRLLAYPFGTMAVHGNTITVRDASTFIRMIGRRHEDDLGDLFEFIRHLNVCEFYLLDGSDYEKESALASMKTCVISAGATPCVARLNMGAVDLFAHRVAAHVAQFLSDIMVADEKDRAALIIKAVLSASVRAPELMYRTSDDSTPSATQCLHAYICSLGDRLLRENTIDMNADRIVEMTCGACLLWIDALRAFSCSSYMLFDPESTAPVSEAIALLQEKDVSRERLVEVYVNAIRAFDNALRNEDGVSEEVVFGGARNEEENVEMREQLSAMMESAVMKANDLSDEHMRATLHKIINTLHGLTWTVRDGGDVSYDFFPYVVSVLRNRYISEWGLRGVLTTHTALKNTRMSDVGFYARESAFIATVLAHRIDDPNTIGLCVSRLYDIMHRKVENISDLSNDHEVYDVVLYPKTRAPKMSWLDAL